MQTAGVSLVSIKILFLILLKYPTMEVLDNIRQGVDTMMPKYNLFTKIVILIVIMLMPIAGLYFFSNKTSTDVLREELNKSNINQLNFFQDQVNTNIDTLAMWSNLLVQDPDISDLKDIMKYEKYLDLNKINLAKRIQTKIRIQESSSDWNSRVYIYSPKLNRVISVNDVDRYAEDDLKREIRHGRGWKVKRIEGDIENRFLFSWYTVSPYSSMNTPEKANLIIEVRFDSRNIANMLDKFKSDGRRDPFYYKKGLGAIYNRTSDRALAGQLIHTLEQQELKDIENRTVEIDGEKYLVNIVRSETTGWYLIDYMPLSDIVQPIQKSNQLFYISLGCLLLMSFLAAYLLYAGVQVPMKRLVQGFQRLKNADYSVRMVPKGNTEFSFVFTRFNSMVAQIQELFEKVYLEKIHVREARLKQLQSQINPHFFYNCFSFISSMAKLQDYRAVIAMAENLSKYYRYTTRQERSVVPLSEELDFVTNYLEIQKMRMKRLNYEVEMPLRMKKLMIPPLMIQPIVENAVIHGIESHGDSGLVRISGECGENEVRLTIEDNGKGMSEDQLLTLQQKLCIPMDEEMGCGLWNVHQRMQLQFGEEAGITLTASPLGGVKVILRWSGDMFVATGSEGSF